MMNQPADMTNKTVLITGGNSGLGRATAIALAERGARIILACRSQKKTLSVQNEIAQIPMASEARFYSLDLASFASIRRCAEELLETQTTLDVLINNAGVMPTQAELTEDGFELNIGVNYLGHFLFTNLLLPILINSAPARIIHIASLAHKTAKIDFSSFKNLENFGWLKSYGQAKLANILFSNELSRRLTQTQVTSNALHPGIVATSIVRDMPEFFLTAMTALFQSPEKGAQTAIELASAVELETTSGHYYSSGKRAKASKLAQNNALAAQLWEHSEILTGLAK